MLFSPAYEYSKKVKTLFRRMKQRSFAAKGNFVRNYTQ